MAINIPIYSSSNSTSVSVSVDFVGDVLVENWQLGDGNIEYYFKLSTTTRGTDNAALPIKVVKALDDLALNGVLQRASNIGTAYTDINSMVVDYVYDFIHGHTKNLNYSGCTEQKPLKFK